MEYKLSNQYNIYKFSKENPVALYVDSGSTICIETMDCFANQIQSETDVLENIDLERVNPATGPIYVRDAYPGDILKVSIEDITVNKKGVMLTGKNLGVLGEELTDTHLKIVPIIDDKIIFNSNIKIPVNPMIGVIGVAPEIGECYCGVSGPHGGNMDNTMISVGSTLYLPIFVEGALFALGDLHAAMGDGEIGVSGVEVAGSVKVKLEVIKGFRLRNPLLENNEFFSTIASSKNLDSAVELAIKDMAEFLKERMNLPLHEIVMLMSALGSTQICKVIEPTRAARFLMPRWIIGDLF
ncbi:MAG TPA: acetamidase [Clostridiaceae bacterium]|nr:acetamidase [Clostridiaceae bacterium]